jgi:hypothetical protein
MAALSMGQSSRRVQGRGVLGAPAFVTLLAALALLLTGARPAYSQLAKVETPEARLVYVPDDAFLIPHAARTFLNSLAFQKRLFDFTPTERITVLLTDFADAGGASANSVPRNNLAISIAPVNAPFETVTSNDRMNLIMNHELVHIVTLDRTARSDRMYRRLFSGKVLPVPAQPESVLYFFLTTPRVAAPRWFHEGIATFLDTWMAGGIGRAQSGFYEMVFRSMVKDGVSFYDPLGLVSEGTEVDFMLQTNSYLYGTRFMVWVARTFGPQKLVAWVARHDGGRAYYASEFERVFGISLDEAWARWAADERTFQQANLEAVRQFPLTPATDLTQQALGSVSRAFYDPRARTVYAAFNYPGVVAHVGSIAADTGKVERLATIKGPVKYMVTSLARDPDSGTLYFTTDNDTWRDLVALDPSTKRTTRLMRDVRIGNLVFDRTAGAIWGIRDVGGLCSIVKIPRPFRAYDTVHTFPYGTVLYDLDVSPDGSRLVASFGDISGKQDVRVLSVEALGRHDVTPVARFDFGQSVPNNFVFSPDGRALYGSAYYTGVSNIFRYDLETAKVDAVTNTDTGFFRPIPLGGEELIAFRYTGTGFVPARLTARPIEDINPITFLAERLVAEHPVIETWNVGSPAKIPYDSLAKTTGVYRMAGGLRRESLYPVVQGYKSSPAIGARLNLSDPLSLNILSLTASYSPDASLPGSERAHVNAEYQRYDWRATASYNNADFYDLFGPTKRGRRGYAAEVSHRNLLIFDEPRFLNLDISGSIAGNLDRLPEYQNVEVDVDRLYSVEAVLAFADVRNSQGAVDDETGTRWSATAQARAVDGSAYPKLWGTYDRGTALPIGHSSLWFRNAAGFSPRDRTQPFANFYFGGFRNNYVDHAGEKQYRELEAFPGTPIDEIGGRNFAKSTLEWNLPPVRFRRAGTPGFYASWLRPAIFVSGLVTNLDAPADRRTAMNLGAQVDLRFTMLSVLRLTLSAGAAVAVEQNRQPRRSAMVSLKVL